MAKFGELICEELASFLYVSNSVFTALFVPVPFLEFGLSLAKLLLHWLLTDVLQSLPSLNRVQIPAQDLKEDVLAMPCELVWGPQADTKHQVASRSGIPDL